MRLEPIWHLRGVGEAEERWEFSTNYKVPIENNVLRNLLQGDTRPPIRLSDDPGLLEAVRVLVNEARSRTGGQIEITEGGYSVTGRRELDRLMRKPTQRGRERVVICVGYVVGAGGRTLHQFQEELAIADLSPASSHAVFNLDRFAAEQCARIFGQKAQSLDDYPPEAIPTPRRVSIFVSYRRTHAEAARGLYDALVSAGGGLLFDPYIDHHNMQLGNWKEQILGEINRTDVFMPLVTHDYAQQGSVSHEEFLRAKGVARDRQLDDFFAPVFLGDPRSAAGLELRSFDGFEAGSEEEISAASAALDHWLGRVVTAGLGRDQGQGQ